MKIKKNKVIVSLIVIFTAVSPLMNILKVDATSGWSFSVSPMTEKILLNPGEHYSSSLTIYSSNEYDNDIKYEIESADFFVDENYNNIFDGCNVYCEMKNWIKFESPTEGRLSPGEKTVINYTIDVPKDAPGGGQYASIMVQGNLWTDNSDDEEESDESDIVSAIKEERKIAYTIFAEVTGDVTKQGEITDINVPSFLLSGNIKGSSSVKNTGNVHGEAKYKLQVFPFFSDEEIYTNEENPTTATVLPDRTRYEETVWEGTPKMGIFNVIYSVEFEGVTKQISKMVIICPIWLLFLIIFAIALLIIWIVMKIRGKKQGNRNNE